MTTYSMRAPNIRAAVYAVRRETGTDVVETLRSGGEEGVYRVQLSNGDVIELQVEIGIRTEIFDRIPSQVQMMRGAS